MCSCKDLEFVDLDTLLPTLGTYIDTENRTPQLSSFENEVEGQN